MASSHAMRDAAGDSHYGEGRGSGDKTPEERFETAGLPVGGSTLTTRPRMCRPRALSTGRVESNKPNDDAQADPSRLVTAITRRSHRSEGPAVRSRKKTSRQESSLSEATTKYRNGARSSNVLGDNRTEHASAA